MTGDVRRGDFGQESKINTSSSHSLDISPNAEYTPPVIYSRQTSAKLVYRVEAYFSKDQLLAWHPGQPVSVTLQ